MHEQRSSSTCDTENTKILFVIFYPFILPQPFGFPCGSDLPTIFHSKSYDRADNNAQSSTLLKKLLIYSPCAWTTAVAYVFPHPRCNLHRSTPGFDSSYAIQHDCSNLQINTSNFPCFGFSHNHCHTKVLGKKVTFHVMGDSLNNIYCNTLTEAH